MAIQQNNLNLEPNISTQDTTQRLRINTANVVGQALQVNPIHLQLSLFWQPSLLVQLAQWVPLLQEQVSNHDTNDKVKTNWIKALKINVIICLRFSIWKLYLWLHLLMFFLKGIRVSRKYPPHCTPHRLYYLNTHWLFWHFYNFYKPVVCLGKLLIFKNKSSKCLNFLFVLNLALSLNFSKPTSQHLNS